MHLFLADRFSALPEGCPVVYVASSYVYKRAGVDPGTIIVEKPNSMWASSFSVALSDVQVDLSTPAAARAFAPALIVAVRFPEGRYNDSLFPPVPLRDVARDNYVLIGYILDSGALCAYMPRHELVTGATPEEALLNGLKAALDAAKDAQ